MEPSILKTVKKILGIADNDTSFDIDLITQINSVFQTLKQLGIGPSVGYQIESEDDEWDDFDAPGQINSVKNYVPLKCMLYFDPPTTSFVIEARERQVAELEWRMNVDREYALYPLPEEV